MASVCGSMFKSLGSNMWTNRNEWGTRLIQKGKFPRIDQVDSEKQKARNSQTFALKSLSLQIPLVLQLQSLRSRFWKIHCGILWKRIQCGHLSNSWCASHLAEKKKLYLPAWISSLILSWYSDIYEKKLQWLWLDILDMQNFCRQGTNISCGMQFLQQIWRRNAKSSNWSGSLGSRPARGIHRNPGRNPGRAMMLEHDGQS